MGKNWKQYLGIAFLVFSIVPLCTVELLLLLPVSRLQALALSTVYLALGEGAFLLAVALLGKAFIQSVKNKAVTWFARPQNAPPHRISKGRHYLGVSLLLLSFVSYPITELALFFCNLDANDLRLLLILLVSGEVLCILSLFILGEEFWDRLQHLFRWPGADAQSK